MPNRDVDGRFSISECHIYNNVILKMRIMKQVLMITMMSALLAMPVMAQHHRGHYNNHSCEYRQDHKGGNKLYVKSRDEVFYNGRPMRGVHARTFKELGGGYAKDTYYVYYCGKRLDRASANSFRVLKNGYAKDAFNVYFLGDVVRGVSVNSFRVLGNGYSKDNFYVYYRGQRMDRASANSFKVMKNGYAKDNFNTYYRGKRAI